MMRTKITVHTITLALLLLFLGACGNKKEGAEHTKNSAGEHVKKESKSKTVHDASLHTLMQPTSGYALSTVPAITLKRSAQTIEITASGYTAYNTNEVGSISAKISGRIKKLYVRYRYQLVKKGEKIMDIYSPELLTAQQNLLFLIKNDPENTMMINAIKDKLALLGFQGGQLKSLIKNGEALSTVSIFSKYSGHIHETLNAEMNTTAQASAMADATSVITQELSLQEGMYLEKGKIVFKVYNPAKVWALLNIYPADQQLIKTGDKVIITSEAKPGHEITGWIHFIEPVYRLGSKTATVWVNVDNSSFQLPIGSQLQATIYGKSVSADWLPKEAVLNLGIEKAVFIKSGRGYKAHKI